MGGIRKVSCYCVGTGEWKLKSVSSLCSMKMFCYCCNELVQTIAWKITNYLLSLEDVKQDTEVWRVFSNVSLGWNKKHRFPGVCSKLPLQSPGISTPSASWLCSLGLSHYKMKRTFYERLPHLATCESKIILELGGILDIRRFT